MSILCVILGYLIGSISTSTILSKWVKRIDIREHGSGNAGATNTMRVLGPRYGIAVLLLDVLKGMIAVWLAWELGHHHIWICYLAGLAAIIGHNWPIFFGFRGGKGIATTIGVFLSLLWLPTLLAGVIAIAVIALTRYVSLGAIVFVILTPVFVAILRPDVGTILFTCAVAIVSIYRHRANIQRLLRGEEHRIFKR